MSLRDQAAQHSYIATNYISSLSSFLRNNYNVPADAAVALAWAGLTETDVYQNAQTFNVDENTSMLKEEMERKSSEYMGGNDKPLAGTPLCN